MSPSPRLKSSGGSAAEERPAAETLDLRKVRPGDVLLRSISPAKKWPSAVQQTFDNGFRAVVPLLQGTHPHSLIYEGKGTVLESLNNGVVRRPIREALRGVDSVAVLRPEDPTVARAALENVQGMLGEPYGYGRLVGAGAGTLLPVPGLRALQMAVGEDGPICSSLIATAYDRAGLPLTGDVPPELATPADLLASENLRLVALKGHEAQPAVVGRHAPMENNVIAGGSTLATAAVTYAQREKLRAALTRIGGAAMAGLRKFSDVETSLRPHQERVIQRMRNQSGLVVAHGLGSGKTLTSLGVAEDLGKDTTVLLPAALRENYAKEIAKHIRKADASYTLESLQRAAGRKELPEGDLLIVDEAHRLRDPATATNQVVRDKADRYAKRMMLSATPVYNHPADLAALINLAAAKEVLPASRRGFEDRFYSRRTVKPGFFDRLRGVKPGEEVTIKKDPELRTAIKQWVDFHANSRDGFPDRTDEVVEVEMTPRQREVYETLMGKAPVHLRLKVRAGLPPSKQEAGDLNTFLTGVRQASNTPRPYVDNMTPEEELANAPKIREAVRRLAEKAQANPDHRAVVYSNYLAGGLDPYARMLDAQGIRYGRFTGDVDKKERDELVRSYNRGDIQALLISSAGGEGLDLKGTRQIQILEPHWNDAKLEQATGRGIRFGSHTHLPEDQRNVHVESYRAVLPKPSRFKRLLGAKADTSADQYLALMAAQKAAIGDSIEQLMASTTAEWARENPPG